MGKDRPDEGTIQAANKVLGTRKRGRDLRYTGQRRATTKSMTGTTAPTVRGNGHLCAAFGVGTVCLRGHGMTRQHCV